MLVRTIVIVVLGKVCNQYLFNTSRNSSAIAIRTDCQVWSMLLSELAPRTSHSPHPSHRTCQLDTRFSWIPGSSALSTQIQPLSC